MQIPYGQCARRVIAELLPENECLYNVGPLHLLTNFGPVSLDSGRPVVFSKSNNTRQ